MDDRSSNLLPLSTLMHPLVVLLGYFSGLHFNAYLLIDVFLVLFLLFLLSLLLLLKFLICLKVVWLCCLPLHGVPKVIASCA